MMENKIYYGVVLYNTRIIDFILSNKFLNKEYLIFADNSDNCKIKQENLNMTFTNYIDMQGNKGLSKAYKSIIRYIVEEKKECAKHTWVFFADDDTKFSEEYLKNVILSVKKGSAIISGIVKTQSGCIMSPKLLYSNGFVKEIIKEVGFYQHLYCINSGLVVNLDIFEKGIEYNENLFVDLIDYEFMFKLSLNSLNYIEIVSGDINQTFSGISKASFEADTKRFRIFVKDFGKYCDLTNRPFYFKYIILIKRWLNLSVRHKKIIR